jgi:hypothetical protein
LKVDLLIYFSDIHIEIIRNEKLNVKLINMKVKICSKLIITLGVILFASCDKNNETVERDELQVFEFQCTGGWIGLNENLKISADSMHYSINYHELGTGESKNYQTAIKTSDEQWSSLTGTFDLETFTKIKDGSCRACVDGFDETFSFTKIDTTYSVYNGNADEHYQQLQDFFDLFFEQVANFETVAGFRE